MTALPYAVNSKSRGRMGISRPGEDQRREPLVLGSTNARHKLRRKRKKEREEERKGKEEEMGTASRPAAGGGPVLRRGCGGGGGKCELCGAAGRVYCESDEAVLCWACDARVHGANFLVARHARALLCRRCAGPTPWRAAGARLGPSASLCPRCCVEEEEAAAAAAEEEDNEDGMEEDEDEGEEDDDDDEEEEDEEGEGENQVVPWAGITTPPPGPSSSSSEESTKEDLHCSTSAASRTGKDEMAAAVSRSGGSRYVPRTSGEFNDSMSVRVVASSRRASAFRD